MPAHLAQAVAAFIGPIPRYAPCQRAASCALGPYERSGSFGSLARREQLNRLQALK